MKKITPLKAIRAKCLDCSAGQPSEVRKCSMEDCSLFFYRFGRNPELQGKRKGNSEALRKYREEAKSVHLV